MTVWVGRALVSTPLHRVPREGGGPVGRFALVLVQEDWIPAFAGNADLMVRFQKRPFRFRVTSADRRIKRES